MVNNASQFRYHKFFKSEKSGDFISFVSVVTKNIKGNESKVELVITTKSGQIIINESNSTIIGDNRYEQFNMKEFGSVTNRQVFFSDLIFQEYSDLQFPNGIDTQEKIFEKFNTIINSLKENSKDLDDCSNLESALDQAFAIYGQMIASGNPNAEAFFNLVIIPLLAESAYICSE